MPQHDALPSPSRRHPAGRAPCACGPGAARPCSAPWAPHHPVRPATGAEVTRCWRDATLANCELRAQIALLQAGGSGGSRSLGAWAGGAALAAPVPARRYCL